MDDILSAIDAVDAVDAGTPSACDSSSSTTPEQASDSDMDVLGDAPASPASFEAAPSSAPTRTRKLTDMLSSCNMDAELTMLDVEANVSKSGLKVPPCSLSPVLSRCAAPPAACVCCATHAASPARCMGMFPPRVFFRAAGHVIVPWVFFLCRGSFVVPRVFFVSRWFDFVPLAKGCVRGGFAHVCM